MVFFRKKINYSDHRSFQNISKTLIFICIKKQKLDTLDMTNLIDLIIRFIAIKNTKKKRSCKLLLKNTLKK